jgi:hypothetical protein
MIFGTAGTLFLSIVSEPVTVELGLLDDFWVPGS